MVQALQQISLTDVFQAAGSFILFMLGAIASWFISRFADSYAMRQSIDLRGEWYSQWRPQNVGQRSVWCNERVTITRKLGRYVLKSHDNDLGYDWIATTKLEGRKHLVGTWRSALPGARTKGIMSFTVANQGTAMFGTFHGPNDHDTSEVGPWVLARRESELASMKSRLKLFRAGTTEPK